METQTLLRRLARCFGTRRRHRKGKPRHGRRDSPRGGTGTDADNYRSFFFVFFRRTRPSGAARFSRGADVERHETPTPTPTPRRRRWLRLRVFARSPSPPCGSGTTTRAVEPRPAAPATTGAATIQASGACGGGAGGHHHQEFSRERAAAATVQAHFRGHLARRAFRALRSLVKLQALARGAYVREQASVAIRCMKVLVRLQVRVRSRQLLLRQTRPAEGGRQYVM